MPIDGSRDKKFDDSIPESLAGLAFDGVFEFSGSPEAVKAAIALCDVGGRVMLVGTVMPTPAVGFDPEQVVRRCMAIHGVHNYAWQDLVAAIRFLTEFEANYPWQTLVERTFSLEAIASAVEFALVSRPVRVAIRP